MTQSSRVVGCVGANAFLSASRGSGSRVGASPPPRAPSVPSSRCLTVPATEVDGRSRAASGDAAVLRASRQDIAAPCARDAKRRAGTPRPPLGPPARAEVCVTRRMSRKSRCNGPQLGSITNLEKGMTPSCVGARSPLHTETSQEPETEYVLQDRVRQVRQAHLGERDPPSSLPTPPS